MYNKTTLETNIIQGRQEEKIRELNELREEYARLVTVTNPFEIDINQLARRLEARGLIERNGVIQPNEDRRAARVLIKYVVELGEDIERMEYEIEDLELGV